MYCSVTMIYSPTQTIAFMDCPASWWLRYHEGWVPRMLTKADIAKMLGSSFHKAIAHWRADPATSTPDNFAANYAREALAKAIVAGHCFHRDAESPKDALPDRVANLVARFIKEDPIPPDWRLGNAELILPNHGNAIVDQAVSLPTDQPTVLDYKVKDKLEARYYDKTVAEYAHTWQMMHYAWAYGEHIGQPVTQYWICLVVASPTFSAKLHQYYIDPELMELWVQSAQAVWRLMADIEAGAYYPWHNFHWHTRWGREPYADAFLRHRLHDHLLEADYVKIGGRDGAT